MSSCDLLTTALLKLGQVDTYDADAVLEEMQSFESILDQVQISLSKKMGSDVGLQGAMPLFKSGHTAEDSSAAATAATAAVTADALPPKTSSGSSKSYLSSWRKLRSKNSGFGGAISSPPQGSKDQLTISSLPMTPTPNSQSAIRDVSHLHFDGPNANYMVALARLCDAAQVVGGCSLQTYGFLRCGRENGGLMTIPQIKSLDKWRIQGSDTPLKHWLASNSARVTRPSFLGFTSVVSSLAISA